MPDHFWIVPVVAFALAQIAVLATSIYLHRGLAHRSLRLHPIADVCFRAVLWLTTGQNRREWVAVHRKHHAFTDREGDPHSPRLLGLWRVQLANVYYYVREARNRETIRTFAPDLPEDRWDRAVFSRSLSGLAIGIALLCLTFGAWAGLAAGAVHAVLYVFVLAPLINGLGHWRGAQNFGNTAYNSKVLAWVTGGESLHNNHHAYPRAPKFSMRRFEFDPSWVVIRGLAALRLLRIVGRPQVVDGESEGRPLESTAGAGQLARAGGSAGRARHANRRVNQKERTGRVITR
jgi:stearoyl-CoA desaturase (delta-9 desaturase)